MIDFLNINNLLHPANYTGFILHMDNVKRDSSDRKKPAFKLRADLLKDTKWKRPLEDIPWLGTLHFKINSNRAALFFDFTERKLELKCSLPRYFL